MRVQESKLVRDSARTSGPSGAAGVRSRGSRKVRVPRRSRHQILASGFSLLAPVFSTSTRFCRCWRCKRLELILSERSCSCSCALAFGPPLVMAAAPVNAQQFPGYKSERTAARLPARSCCRKPDFPKGGGRVSGTCFGRSGKPGPAAYSLIQGRRWSGLRSRPLATSILQTLTTTNRPAGVLGET